MPNTPERDVVELARELLSKATPGPWHNERQVVCV